MHTEFNSIEKNTTWSLMPLPISKTAFSSHWVYKVQPGVNGGPDRFKAHLVAPRYEQKLGIDFTDTFALVVRWEIIKNLIAIAVHLNKPFHQLDVLTIFLNGILDEDVFMKQPQSFVKPGEGHLICKLHKPLYGLHQSP